MVVGGLLHATSATAQQTPADRAKAEIAQQEQKLKLAVETAERACLVNVSTVQKNSISAGLDAIVNKASGAVGLEAKSEQLRGAARDLPAAIRVVEDDAIRKCMNAYIQPVFALTVQAYQQAAPNAEWPDPLDFRFNFTRGPSRDAKLYSEYLRLDLQRRGRSLTRRLIVQDPRGIPYFQADVGYPSPGEDVKGTIVAEMKGDAQLTSTSAVITDICFDRAKTFPADKSMYHDLFDCVEGRQCRPSTRGTGWLQACAAGSPAKVAFDLSTARAPRLVHAAFVEPGLFWRMPSLQSLAERNVEGTGYTVFTIESDGFRARDITSVEVDVKVNGVPVREDGLAPAQRPVSNDPASTFTHAFALQTLDFEGADNGCDRIELRLRPVYETGRKGDEQTAQLTYVALRDVPARKQRIGTGTLQWSASYITPQREWRHVSELHSYIYPSGDGGARERSAANASADKRWLDGLELTYDGKKVVGVVRPPRTIQSNGTAAFGLAAGLVQPSGQVRFTFSETDARALSAFMIAQRTSIRDAAKVIDPRPYVFQAVGGARTVPGVCTGPA